MFPEKNIALLKIQTQPGKRLSQFKHLCLLIKGLMLACFVTRSFYILKFFLSLFLSPASGPGKVTVGPGCTRKRTCARARTTLSPSVLLLNNHRTSQSRFIVYYSLRFSGPLFVPSSRDSPSSRGSFMEPLKSTTIRMEEGRDGGS